MPETGAGAAVVVGRGVLNRFMRCLTAGIFAALVCLSPAGAQTSMSPLVTSILAEDLEGARSALDAGVSANAIDPELQRAPLPIAVSPGSPRMAAMVELLVSRGADLNAEDAKTKLTPLMAATIVVETTGPFAVLEFQKSKLIVERLLNLGADPSRATQVGETPLLVAVAAGNMEVVRLLIARGAKPDQAGARGETPLARATRQKRTDIAEALIAAGAKPLPPRVAARGAGAEPEPEALPADAAAATGSSGISGWLIGGLAVAAGVVAAAVVANAAKKRPNPPAPPQPPQPSPAPQPQPQPVACQPGYALTNGTCQPVPNTMPVRPTVQVFDGEYNSTRVLADGFTHVERITVSGLNATARHTFTNGSASGGFDWTGTITQTAADRGTIAGNGTITNLGTRPFTLLPGSSIGRNAAGIMSINWTGTDPRFGGIGWTSDRVPAVAPPPQQCVAPQVMQNGACVMPPTSGCVAPLVLVNGACVALAPILPPPGVLGAPGQVFRDCADCPEMVVIPAGSFMLGSPLSEPQRFVWETQPHPVNIANRFAAGRFEVTFDEWDACVRDKGCSTNPADAGWGRGRQPVINVSWTDAKQYTAWLSRKTGKPYSLLTDAQWEYSARAGTTTAFSFGPSISPQQANYDSTVSYAGGPVAPARGRALPVGSFPPNAFGLYEMHGNITEWIEDCSTGIQIQWCGSALRGGSWSYQPHYLRSAMLNYAGTSSFTRTFIGLRVARGDLPSAPNAPPVCVPPQLLQNGVCVVPPPITPPVQPPQAVVPPPVPPIAPPVVVVPPPLQPPLVVLPPPVLPAPLPVVPPVVVVPAPTPPAPAGVPSITNVTPANMAALFRIALNGGSDAVTVSWSSTGPVAVSDVAIAYTWTCASGPRTFAVHATPAPGANSAVLRWFASGVGIGCPELGGAGPHNAPTSAVINLTYKASGAGPDLVASRPFGQIACLTFYPDEAAFPVNVPVNEVWSPSGSFSFNRQLMHPYGYASFSGLADAALDNAFRVCNGRFISTSAVRSRAPTAADAQSYRNVVQAANGMLTFTEQVMRPGAPVSENAVFTYRYSIATGEYSFFAMGGQRNTTGGVSALNASRTGQVKVRVEVSSPQDPGYVPMPAMVDTPQQAPICTGPMVLDGAGCVSSVAIPYPPGSCVPPRVCGPVAMPPLVPPVVPPVGVAGTRIDNTPRNYDIIPGQSRPQYFLWQMNSKILAIGLPRVPLQGGVTTVSGIGTSILLVTVWSGGIAPGQIPGAPTSFRQTLDLDVTLEVPPAGSPPPPLNSVERVYVQSKNVVFPSAAPQIFTQKVRSKIVNIFDIAHSPDFAATIRYEGIGTDTLTITVFTGGTPGSALATFSAQVMY